MTVVVTGASGHVGANLVRTLIDKNRSVRALLHKHSKSLEGLDIDTVSGNICDLDSLRHAFSGAEVVYHLAARISISMDDWSLLETVNVCGTRNVIEACISCGVRRLVYFSSIHALAQEPLDTKVDESRPWAERNSLPYARSKALACKEILCGVARGLNAIILSPTAIVGPHDYQPSHFGEVLLSLACGRLPALVSSGFDWVDVRDVAEYAIRAEARAPIGAHYLLSGHWVSLPEVASIVANITDILAPRVILPLWLASIGTPIFTVFDRITKRRPLYTSGSIKALSSNHSISHDKATRELGYQPRPFRETIIDTLHWFEETDQLIQPLKLQPKESI
ncbi:NAD-dependent epimerase/dehydratase family protein [Chloroflexota bacterium]